MQLKTIEPKQHDITTPETLSSQETNFSPEIPRKEKISDTPQHTETNKTPKLQTLKEVEVEKVSNALEHFWDAMGVSLNFKVDKETDILQVEIIDPRSNKVLKKIPADEILHLAASLKDSIGFLVDKKF